MRKQPSAIYELIWTTSKQPMNLVTTKRLCSLAEVSKSGYYKWIQTKDVRLQREKQDEADFELVLQAYRYRTYKKGVRGIYMRLLHMGIRMNPKKIRRLMRKYRLYCPIRQANPYRRMAKAIQTNAIADNLVKREFRLHGPRKILLTDITYIPYNGTFCYLSVIKDAFTQQVLSHVLSPSLQVDFVLETVEKLMQKHGDSLDPQVMVHSDQGCHYTSVKFRELLQNFSLRQSMSRRGNCWDNAPQESFFGHMKDELELKQKKWSTFSEVQADIDNWIDYYNTERYQWNLEKLSPDEFYNYTLTGIYPLSNIPA